MLANKLTQLQIGELSRQKKDREKAKPQAPVTVAVAESKPEPTPEAPATQAPVIAATMAPPGAQQPQTIATVSCPPQQPTSAWTPQVPPIHVHLNTGEWETHPPPHGRGCPVTGPPQRGRWRPQNQVGPSQMHRQQQQPQGPPSQQNRLPLQCWVCGTTGHISRSCPHNPGAAIQPGTWVGPAAQWQN